MSQRSMLKEGLCLLAVVLAVPACSSPDSRAREALARYDSAAAANDLPRARKALLELVSARDNVAEYWIELGKVQAAMGSDADAYYALRRAYELNRTDPAVLRALTELAVRSGDITEALRYAEELEPLGPRDRWVTLARGYAALGEGRFDDSLELSDHVLSDYPYESAAKVLKGRALIGKGRAPDAIELLEAQIRVQPADRASRSLLLGLYRRQDEWERITSTLSGTTRSTDLTVEDQLLLIQAALRSENFGEGRRASYDLLQREADPKLIASVTDMWLDYWPSRQRIVDARKLAEGASQPAAQLAYAAFLAKAGSPADALDFAAPTAGLPIRPENAQASAVAADALLRAGRVADAKTLLDAVLRFDPGNPAALRSRAELHLRTGNATAAVEDAQKLVTVHPGSSRDRLLLARSFESAGDRRSAERALWEAFSEIPANERIFSAVLATRRGQPDAVRELRSEFARQRNAELLKGVL